MSSDDKYTVKGPPNSKSPGVVVYIPHSEANEYLRTVADVIARTVGGCDSVHLLYKGQKISLDCWIWELFDAKGDILNNMYYVKNLGAETNDENGGWHP